MFLIYEWIEGDWVLTHETIFADSAKKWSEALFNGERRIRLIQVEK